MKEFLVLIAIGIIGTLIIIYDYNDRDNGNNDEPTMPF